jgi:hypothetical protein
MNIHKKLKDLGIEHEDEFLNHEQFSKVTLTRDVGMQSQFIYFIKYNRIPSSLEFSIKLKDFDEFIRYLANSRFKVVFTNTIIDRYWRSTVYLSDYSIGMGHTMIEVEYNLGRKNTRENQDILDKVLQKTEDDDEEEEDATCSVTIYHSVYNPKIYEIFDKFAISPKTEQEGKVLLFEKDGYGDIVLTPHKIKNYDLDINKNYNDDFSQVHDKVSEWVNDFKTKNNKLVLFHGVPGSGKTNYIKYLLSLPSDVKKIYIPPYFIQSMADPAFLPIIKREKKSVLIIEDAEKILLKREDSSDNSIISILLNLCDGIMADILDFKIIATFNTDEELIDDALKRKGRMFLKYKFDALSEQKTKNLYGEVHGTEPPKKNMTLAEIYNSENVFGKKAEPRKVGFGI